MIDIRIIKDASKTIDLCKTFTYDEVLNITIDANKEIDYYEQISENNEYMVIFTDGTTFTFETDKNVGHIEIDNDLKVYIGNKSLKQMETEKVYGNSVIDIIVGYNNNKPYSNYNYIEI